MGYTRSDSAKKKLTRNFTEDVDFQVFRHVAVNSTGQGIEPKSGGRPKDAIKLSVDCFKAMAMMAQTEQGKIVRQYFLECERIAKSQVTNMIALSTQMEARIAEIVEERISIATESLTTKIVEQVTSALAEQLPLEELRSQVGEIYEDISERKNRRRSWYLPADTPKDKIPDNYIKVSDGWLSPAAFEYQRRRSRWEMLRLEL